MSQDRLVTVIAAFAVIVALGVGGWVVFGGRGSGPAEEVLLAEQNDVPYGAIQQSAGGGAAPRMAAADSPSAGPETTEAANVTALEPTTEVVEERRSATPTVRIRVLEDSTRRPLDRVTVRLVEPGADVSDDDLRHRTDSSGVALFHNVSAGQWEVVLRWGTRAEHRPDTIRIEEGEGGEWTFSYPGREMFAYQLLNQDGSPAGFVELEAGVAIHQWQEPSAVVFETVRTDAQGNFQVPGFAGMRPVMFRSNNAEMFSVEAEPRERRGRGGWGRGGPGYGNPSIDPRPLDADETRTIYRRTDVVLARGLLVNAPRAHVTNPFIATVQSRDYNYIGIEVHNDQFTFAATPGSTARILVSRDSVPGQRLRNRSFEKVVEVEMPEEPGPYDFEIHFEDRLEIAGRVELEDGTPVADVRVIATGYDATLDEVGDSGPVRGFRGTGGANAQLTADPTDRRGRFTFELPPARAYVFTPRTDSLPDDYKGYDDMRLEWDDLKTGRELVIVLHPSSLFWGEVVGEDGRPVAGAFVSAGGDLVEFSAWDYNVRTDEDGLFELNVPRLNLATAGTGTAASGRSVVLTARHQSMMGVAPAVPDSTRPARIEMRQVTSGNFVVTSGGEPVDRVEVSSFFDSPGYENPVPRRDMQVYESEEGRFQFRNVPRGITWFAFSIPGRPLEESVVIQIPPDAGRGQEIPVDLTPPEM